MNRPSSISIERDEGLRCYEVVIYGWDEGEWSEKLIRIFDKDTKGYFPAVLHRIEEAIYA